MKHFNYFSPLLISSHQHLYVTQVWLEVVFHIMEYFDFYEMRNSVESFQRKVSSLNHIDVPFKICNVLLEKMATNFLSNVINIQ